MFTSEILNSNYYSIYMNKLSGLYLYPIKKSINELK